MKKIKLSVVAAMVIAVENEKNAKLLKRTKTNKN